MVTSVRKPHVREVAAAALRSLVLLCFASTSVLVEAQDVGVEGPSYHGTDAFPSGTKPESKLWFNDGAWWGCLWSTAQDAYSIQRLDSATESWIDTGVLVDHRPISRSDCLWNGEKLYVGSHRWASGGGDPGHPLVVYRFDYDPIARRYSLDPGFPVQIGSTSAETMVLDQDSTGTLWAVWIEGLRLRVTHTLNGDDHAWKTPSIHPQNTSAVSDDDIASVVHFGGNKIGVMWSDQIAFDYWFTVHVDGDPDTFWSTPVRILHGIGDDHINLKAADDGRLFAVLKTSTDEIQLAVRATNGVWTTHLVTAAADDWTRAICVLDEDANKVHVVATSPELGGSIYEKVSPMGAISFPSGVGTPVIRDAKDQEHNDTTASKQRVGGASGLVVVASHQPSERYWHHQASLGGPVAGAPVAAAAAWPHTGFEALTVQFRDTSSNVPTSWFWTFGDGATSTARHPVHTYEAAGTYDVTLTASNALGADGVTLVDCVSVGTPPLALTLHALADTQLREASPGTNYGALPVMRVRSALLDFRSLVEFLVPASRNGIVSAHLRLWVEDGSPDGGQVFSVTTDWQEPFVDWTSAPVFGGPLRASIGHVDAGTWVDVDVSSGVTASGPVAFGLTSASTNSVFYSSREGTHPPELILTLAPPPVASFTADVTTGSVPLTVQFTDTSTNTPTSWTWSFGDGGTSTARNPAHTYTQMGSYTVSLTVSAAGGTDVQNVPGFVQALPRPPVADFGAMPQRGPAPLKVRFSDASLRATTVTWNFGDGTTSHLRNPTHVFATRGTYQVKMTATNAAGSDTKTLTIHAGLPRFRTKDLPVRQRTLVR